MRLPLIVSLCLPLLTTGCFIGDGVAHVVKLAANAPLDRDPAPQPAAAPRDQIKVEELPPRT